MAQSKEMYYLLDIVNSGGEYTYGFISDTKQKKLVKELIKNGELGGLNSSNDGEVEVNFFEIDQILHVYGPAIYYATLALTSYNDKELKIKSKKYFSRKKIENTEVNTFNLSSPSAYFYEKTNEKLPKGSLVFGGCSIEKGIHFPIVIKMDDMETFDIKNVYIGTIDLGETSLSNDEIASKAFYINDENAKSILQLCFEETYDYGLSESIGDIFLKLEDNENKEKIGEILKKCECEILDIEGSGHSQTIYVVVKNSKEKLMYMSDI